jgi:phosphoribosyl 1,2-cyclic phosphate phosphodiesterase
MPDQSFDILQGVNTWIVDALRDTPHSTHFTVAEALAALERAQAQRGVLTNLHIDLDYEALKTRLPDHVEPAYDGLQILAEI